LGRKRTWKWKYLYFCIASLIIIGCIGCSTFLSVERYWKARNYLSQGEDYLDEGRWNEALLMHEKALLLAGKRKPRDTILYNMGLLYAHSGAANMRYSRAILYFKRLAAEFPQSRHTERAKIWIAVLESLKQTGRTYVGISSEETNKGKIEARQAMDQGHQLVNAGNFKQAFEMNRTVHERFPDSSPGDEALFNMALIYAHHKNPEKNYKRSIEYFKQLIAQYQESPFLEQAEIWIDVLGAIEKSKQVDIEIEQKRKELTQ
jgi:outer membrane protein assembly factor BamD (BamD/ComL family)